MRHRRVATAVLPALLAMLLAACSAEPGAATASAAPDAGQWLPAAPADGALPRTLAGFTLLDPQPDGSSAVKGPVFGAAQQLWMQREDGEVRVYSFDGRIFRIEHTLPEGAAFDSAAQSVRAAYGEPADESPSNLQYGKALKVGDTILELRRLGKRVQVFIEDAGTSLKAHSAS